MDDTFDDTFDDTLDDGTNEKSHTITFCKLYPDSIILSFINPEKTI